MIAIKDGNKTKYFFNQVDADNYKDYLQNGLKVIKADSRTYRFNNSDRLIDVSNHGEESKRYVLISGNRRITSEKLQRKHIQAINK